MKFSKKTLARIKSTIDKKYNSLMVTVLGRRAFSDEELALLELQGINTSNKDSLLEMVYYNHLLNDPANKMTPKSIQKMREQQAAAKKALASDSAIEHLNENFKALIEKHKAEVKSRIEGFVRENNIQYRGAALQNLHDPKELERVFDDSELISKLKQTLRDFSQDSNRSWERIVVTEVSNAIGFGSADRILESNKAKNLDDVYVYRIPVNDAALCKFCRKFYLDADGSPAVYRLSTLLNNGTNYGKKTSDWNPVVGATHPNERCGPQIEVRPGWKVMPGGKLDFIGQNEWEKYIKSKVRS